ncbi:MAG: CDP-2,3-bis-(O-geranylgeranyl)-sn-glycerol synthase [Candidatus Saccharimonadales bacterium]
MTVLYYLTASLWFFMPAGASNAVPVLASKLPLLKRWTAPIDNGISFRGVRLLGKNKTWRGLIVGIATAMLVAALQYFIWRDGFTRTASFGITVLTGLLMGLGALLGDVIESFLKRRRGTPPGQGWFPFDQLDYIFGGLLVSYPVSHIGWQLAVSVVITWFIAHLLTVYIGYIIGLRERPI